MTLVQMFDSVTAADIPLTAPAVAGYVGGSFPNFSLIVARCPKALHKSVAVNAGEDADCLDIESGDAVPADGPAWIRRQIARGVKLPCIYADASEMVDVIAVMRGAGIKDAAWSAWVADWNHVQDLMTIDGKLCLAHQYVTEPNGINIDVSVCDPAFFGTPVPAVNLPHYEWMNWTGRVHGVKLNEAAVAKRYDKYRAKQTPKFHPDRAILAVCRLQLKWLAGRVAHEAISKPNTSGPKKGKPSWGTDHRGYRYQQFIHRAQGGRIV